MPRNPRKIRLHKDYLTKGKKLSPGEISSVQDTLRQLYSGDTTPGLNWHRIQGSEPLQSISVTNDIRMIVCSAGGELIVLRVDRHDDAYEWAQKNNGTDRLKNLTARQNLEPEPYVPPDEAASGLLPAVAAGTSPSGSFNTQSGTGMAKPGSELNGPGRRTGDDRLGNASPKNGRVLASALETWNEAGVDLAVGKDIVSPHGGPVLVLGAAGTNKRLAAVVRSLYLADRFAESGERVLLLAHSAGAFERAKLSLKQLLEQAGDEPDLGLAVEAVEVSLFDAWLERQLRSIGANVQVIGANVQPRMSLWRARCDSEATAASMRLEWQDVIQPCGVADLDAWRETAARAEGSRFDKAEMAKLWPVFEHAREVLRAKGLVTRDDACRMVARGMADGTLSSATAAVVVLDCHNLGRQVVHLCRELALATVPKHEHWKKDELERLCLVADPFLRTGCLHLNIQHCDVTPAKTIRLRETGAVTHAVIETAVSALYGLEFDDLTGATAKLDGYRGLEAGGQPAFRRCTGAKDGARQVADWLRELQAADAESTPGQVCLVARTNSRLKDWRKALRKLGVKTRRLKQDREPEGATDKVWVAKPEELDPGAYFQAVAFLDADRKSWPRRKALRLAVDETDRNAVELREQSLFYLACTRARRHLLFCSQGSFAPWLEELAPPAPEPESEIQSPAQPPARMQAMKYPVLIDQEITDAMLQVLHDRGCETYMWNPGGETPRMEETVGFFVYGHALIDGPIMDRMPKLKVISNMGVGVDHIRIPDAAERGIAVGNTPGFVDGATADMAFLLMMAIARNLKKGIDYARGPEFRHFDPTLWHGREINGATLGIYGMGAIGSTVARRASGFNMHVIYHNRNRLSDTREAELNAYWVPRSGLLARADYLLLSLPLSEETEGCMGLAEFRQMQEHAYLINIGRGGLVRTEELVTALDEGQLAGAALDVTEPEPLPRDHPLVEHSDVIITPHLGSATVETREGMFIRTVENLMAGMQDKPLLNQVLQ
ncbi:MAG: hypothetical protein OXC13_01055 [Caldilineaceae bacterium]|nr:hypothetical protein [Caldilineaceae bacterium]